MQKLALALGSNWTTAEADMHDQAVALISHLPVLVSASLLNIFENENNENVKDLMKQLASSGFADTTRVGGGNPKLGTDMSSINTSKMLNGLDMYKSNIEKFERLMNDKNWLELEKELIKAKEIRELFFPL